MDFFYAQDQARKTTKKLIILYLLAVCALIISIYFVAFFMFAYAGGGTTIWNPLLLFWVSAITITIILIGTISRVLQLRKGGKAVAEMLNGRMVSMNTKDPKERQLINVVEEMSIASGLPVPAIYILDNEPTINAFAAGYGTRDAAVGVTRGTLEQLNRDELQGVIAHEFSHIFNGDMRINIRLIGILNGILLIHLMGMMVMRGGAYSSIGRSSSNRKGAGAIMIFGLALLLIGYIGMLFGRMIQSAVSRQREYLADAAAVQYTRNPDGLGGALHKISASFEKPTLKDAHAMEVSHMFFSSSFKSGLDSLFATHPPIMKRIKAINASLDPETVRNRQEREQKRKLDQQKTTAKPKAGGMQELFRPELILAAIGSVGEQDISFARKMLEKLPERIREAVHDPLEAQALVFSLMLSGDSELKSEQTTLIRESFGNELDHAIWRLKPFLERIEPDSYLTVIDLCIPALKEMSKTQYELFKKTIETLIKVDGKISVFEFALEKTIVHNLDAEFFGKPEAEIKYQNVDGLLPEISVLLSAVAHNTSGDPEEAYSAGMSSLEKAENSEIGLKTRKECTFKTIDGALEKLAQSSMDVRKTFLAAAINTAASDGKMVRREIELIRAMGVAIDCPLPILSELG